MQLPLIERKHVQMFSVLLSLGSHFDQKLLKIVKEFSSFILMLDLVGKLDLLFSRVFVQILYRAISEMKCLNLWETCKDGCSEPRTFLLLTSC